MQGFKSVYDNNCVFYVTWAMHVSSLLLECICFLIILLFFFITFPGTCILKNVFNEINQIYCDKVLFCAQHTHTTIHCQLKTLFLSSTTKKKKKKNEMSFSYTECRTSSILFFILKTSWNQTKIWKNCPTKKKNNNCINLTLD